MTEAGIHKLAEARGFVVRRHAQGGWTILTRWENKPYPDWPLPEYPGY